MNLIWVVVISAGGAAYAVLLAASLCGLLRLKRTDPPRLEDAPSVSVVVAARNEEHHIGATVTDLLAQDYPPEKLEIIVVDDNSEDRTTAIVEEIASRDPRVRLIRQENIRPEQSPKKQALERGIRAAGGEVVLTTDADCRCTANWLSSLVSRLAPGVGMVTGQARFDIGTDPPLWQRLQALDFQAQGILAAGLVAAGMPFTCTGASLAFRVALFDEVGGWKGVRRIISGDDELLLAKASRSRWRVVAATGRDPVVLTRPPGSLRELWHQRTRWGSKGFHYRPSRRFILSGIFLFYLGLLSGPAVCLFTGNWGIWLGCTAAKIALDLSVLAIGSGLFAERFRWVDLLLAESLHPPAIVLFALFGNFGGFDWKGRHFRRGGEARR